MQAPVVVMSEPLHELSLDECESAIGKELTFVTQTPKVVIDRLAEKPSFRTLLLRKRRISPIPLSAPH